MLSACRQRSFSPSNLPLIFAATAYRQNWFYPAFMVALGSHYLPFIFLYGMWQFGVLAALLIGSGSMDRYVSAIGLQSGWLVDCRDVADFRVHWAKCCAFRQSVGMWPAPPSSIAPELLLKR